MSLSGVERKREGLSQMAQKRDTSVRCAVAARKYWSLGLARYPPVLLCCFRKAGHWHKRVESTVEEAIRWESGSLCWWVKSASLIPSEGCKNGVDLTVNSHFISH